MQNFEIQTVTGQKVVIKDADMTIYDDYVEFKRGEEIVGFLPMRQVTYLSGEPVETSGTKCDCKGQGDVGARTRTLLQDAGRNLDAAHVLLKKATE